MDEKGIVTSVGSIGINHEASHDRSYWNNPTMYNNIEKLREDWKYFLAESKALGRRRALMRTLVLTTIVDQLSTLPLEAVILLDKQHVLVYLGLNQHSQLSLTHTALTTDPHCTPPSQVRIPGSYHISFGVELMCTTNLELLWRQFGWTLPGVQDFVENPRGQIITVREAFHSQVVGAMIAESLRFDQLTLVEVTEMAVLPEHQGKGLATALIFYLVQRCLQVYGTESVIYGEFNLTTFAHHAAVTAGMTPAIFKQGFGILPDHVSIETGERKPNIKPWNTEYLHSFQVMYVGNAMKQQLMQK